MTQSGFIAGAILALFVLYVAAKGRLTTYTNVLWGPTAAPTPSGGSGGGGGGPLGIDKPLIGGSAGPSILDFLTL